MYLRLKVSLGFAGLALLFCSAGAQTDPTSDPTPTPVPAPVVTATPVMTAPEPVVNATNGMAAIPGATVTTTSPTTAGAPPPDTGNTVGGIYQGAVNNLTNAIQVTINNSTTTTHPAPQTSDYTAGNYFKYYNDLYVYCDSTPMLYILGLPLGTFLTQYKTEGFLGAIMLVAFMIRMGTLMHSEQRDIRAIAAVVLKLFAAGLIYSNPALIYAASMEIMTGTSALVSYMQSNMATLNSQGGIATRLGQVLGAASSMNGELLPLQNKAVLAGLADRAGIFTKYADTPALDAAATDFWAYYLNTLAASMQATTSGNGSGTTTFGTQSYPPLPRLTTASTDSNGNAIVQGSLDDVRAAVVKRYVQLAQDSANMPSGSLTYSTVNLNWSYTDSSTPANTYSYSGTRTVTPLSNFLSSVTANITNALQNVGSSGTGPAQKEDLMNQYSATVRAATSNWVDSQLLDQFAQAMSNSSMSSFWSALQDVGSAAKRSLLGAANNFKPLTLLDSFTNIVSAGVSIVRDIIMPRLMYVGGFLVRTVAELAILGMMVTLPFWFFEGPLKRAFTGSVETLLAASLIVPFWTFFQMLMDALYGGFCALFGAFTAGTGAAVALVSGGTALGAMLGASMLILTAGYLLSSLVLACKSPAMTKGFLSGGSWIAGLMEAPLVGGTAALLVAAGMATAGAGSLVGGAGGLGRLASTAAGRIMQRGGTGASSVAGAAATPRTGWAASKAARGRALRAGGRMALHLLEHGGHSYRALGGYLASSRKPKGEDSEG